MKTIIFILLSTLFASTVNANTNLDAAYKREYIFLTSQIKELKKVKTSLSRKLKAAKVKAQKDLGAAQKKLIRFNSENEKLSERLFRLEQNVELSAENKELLQNTLKQAQLSYGLAENSSIEEAFKTAIKSLNTSSEVQVKAGTFYLKTGEKVDGEILSLGQVSKLGKTGDNYYMLAPAGKGGFKVWEKIENGKEIFAGSFPAVSKLFLFEDPSKAINKKEGKTLIEFISSGGSIAWVIVGMGVFAILLCLIRALSLRTYASSMNNIEEKCDPTSLKETKESIHAVKAQESQKNLFIKVLEHDDKSTIDDIIDEGMLHEHKIIDRFGALILVFAAVAPLMGLLGTVTGMISTFDIITEHGTGDPKLLSQGISEALITTELGLVVAIPTLLFGNILSGWGKNIKQTLDRSILKLVNEK